MNLFKSTLIISALTLLSRIAGLVREVLFAAYFGASSQTDAFFVAFRIPNLLRRLFAEGALSQAFIPVLSEVNTKSGKSACQELAFKVALLLFLTLIFITLLGIIFASYIVLTLSGGFNGDTKTFELSVTLTKIMFPYILFISLTALAAGILNTFLRYNLPAFTPVLLNISFIISIIFLAPHLDQPIYSLAYAVIVGGFAQLGVMIIGLLKINFFSNTLQIIKKNNASFFFDENIKKVFKIFFPATFAVSIAQISLIINTNIASRLETGSVSWLSYADRLMEFPTALLGVALGTVLLPKLAEAWSNEDKTQVSNLIDWGLKLAVLIALPTSIIFFNMSEALAAVVFHYGVFSDNDLAKSALAIRAYAIGIVGLITIKIIAPGFYARQDIKTPVLVGIATLFMTQLLNLFLVPVYQHAGLAYAISIAACFNAILLLIILIRKKIYIPDRSWILFIFRVLISCGVVFVVTDLSNLFFDWQNLKASPIIKICNFSLILLGVIFLYITVGKLTGINFKHFIKRV